MAGIERESLTMLWLPKKGKRAGENEDAPRAVFYKKTKGPGGQAARIALADGAAESPFAKEWAATLAQDFTKDPPRLEGSGSAPLDKWLRPRQEAWRELVPWEHMQWHAQIQAETGALAALIGVVFTHGPELAWEALAVGDARMFVIRGRTPTAAFPDQQGARKEFISSNPESNGGLHITAKRGRGTCLPGDRVVMATGALALWFAETQAIGKDPWTPLEQMDAPRWHPWIREKQERGEMRNDDVTLITFRVSG